MSRPVLVDIGGFEVPEGDWWAEALADDELRQDPFWAKQVNVTTIDWSEAVA